MQLVANSGVREQRPEKRLLTERFRPNQGLECVIQS